MKLDDLERQVKRGKTKSLANQRKRQRERYAFALQQGFTGAEAALLRGCSEKTILKIAAERKETE